MVGAVHLGLLLEEVLLDAGKDGIGGIQVGAAVLLVEVAPAVHLRGPDARLCLFQVGRNMSGKGWENWCHVQFALALQDLLLQLGLSIDPTLWQRSLPAVDVYHSLPGQMGRTGIVGADLLVGHTVLTPYLLPYGLLTRDGKRHVHAVQRHPVDETLPLRPFPPRHRIAEGAVVEEEADGYLHLARYLLGNLRHCFWQLHGIEVIPADIRQAILLDVAVQSYCHGVGVVTTDKDFFALLEQFVGICRGIGLFKNNGFGFAAHHSPGQCLSSLLVGSFERHHSQ